MSSAQPFGSWLLGPADQGRRQLRVRVQLLLTVLIVTTNVVGALVVAGVFWLVRPAEPLGAAGVLAAAVAVPTYVGVAVLVGAAWGTTVTLRALRWATDQRVPSDEERRTALRVPLRLTVMQAVLWAGGVALLTGLAVWLQPALTTTVLLSVAIAGVLVCAVSYLLAEFGLRPIAARALTDDARVLTDRPTAGSGVKRRMLLFWVLGSGVPVAGLMVVAVLALAGDDIGRTRLAVVVLVLGTVVLVPGLLIAVLDARAVVSPILDVRDALHRVEGGDLDVRLQVYDGTELGALQAGFNRMAEGLGERERIRDIFGRHVGHDVARAALLRSVELGGEVRCVSVLFVDLVGSTTYAEERPATDVVALLNRFCGVVVDEVDRRGGLVNKFMGDAVLAVFGAPVDQDDHARAALETARCVAARLAQEVPEVGAGIGVATGEAVAGNVGDQRRFEYTVIGDAVNAAARLTELAKDRPGRVAVSAETVEAAGVAEAAHWEVVETVQLRGRARETRVALQASETRSA
ncbi:adenylate/guanylate cyclase domain-containing protein [Nocardioides perillae]|uniref:Adenylate cyclase n=1 Tax=Nocardioides perillae TaxID=1119534 RepID=A0A7Y9UM73_9ACTN|nr:adenylate cyclase [Nocardioides perillae]